MQKTIYPTWYEFKEDLQKELGRSMLNQEWLRVKPEAPLLWNDSSLQAITLILSVPKKLDSNIIPTQVLEGYDDNRDN
jgi:hypothetical protein